MGIQDINLIGDFQNVSKDYFKTNLYGIRECCQSNLTGYTDANGNFVHADNTNGTGGISNSGGSCDTTGVGSTLPDPVIQDETKELPDVSFDNDASLYNAFGALAIEKFGIAVTVEQTTCVGTGLVQRSAINNAQLDARYWTILQKIFDDCLVPINIAEFLSK